MLPISSICEVVRKSLFWAPTCLPGYEFRSWLACSTSHCQFAKKVEEKLKTNFWWFIESFGSPQLTRTQDGSATSQMLLTGVRYMSVTQVINALNPTIKTKNSHFSSLFIYYRSSGKKLLKYQANSSGVIMSLTFSWPLYFTFSIGITMRILMLITLT